MVRCKLGWLLERYLCLPINLLDFIDDANSALITFLSSPAVLSTSVSPRSFIAVLLFEIKSAFDCVDHGILVHIVRDLGFPWHIYKSFYNHHSAITVDFNMGLRDLRALRRTPAHTPEIKLNPSSKSIKLSSSVLLTVVP